MMALAVLFLVAYAWPIVQPEAPRAFRHGLMRVQDAVWVIFAADYAVRLLLAEHRWRFVRTRPLDLLAVLLPALRPLRLVAALVLVNRQAGPRLRGHVTQFVTVATALVLLISALSVLNVERDVEGATITSFPEALWWAFVTITTVGYGDLAPVTGEGRLYATGLMLCGIALLGIVTATLASWLVEKVGDVGEDQQQATRADVRQLQREVAALREELARQRAAGGQ